MRWLVAFLCVIPLAGSAQLVFRDGFETVSYTVGGQVQGLVGEGLVLRLNAAESLPIQADGPFTFAMAVPSGGDYAVDVQTPPSNPAQACQVENGTGIVVGAPVTDVLVTCGGVSASLPTSPGLPFAPAVVFLYDGPDAPQSGVDPADIDADRVSVLSGRVLDGDGAPLSGATVVVLDHPEFGSTLTGADGVYALAVNGGGELVVDASHPGRLPAQRRVGVPWNTFVPVDAMALVSLDPVVTTIRSGSTGTPSRSR